MHPIFANIQTALFDMDGTLVETDIDFPALKQEALRMVERQGFDPQLFADKDILGTIYEIEELLGEEQGIKFRQQAFDRFEKMEIEYCRYPRIIEGARELLHELEQANIPVGIVTRNSQRVAEAVLKTAELEYDCLVARELVRRVKPDPEHLLYAFDLLSADPKTGLMIGDHWMDVAAGKAAGTRTIGILLGFRPDNFFEPAPPDLLIRSLPELL